MARYEPHRIEPKWQAVWEETGIFKAPDNPTDPAYVLDMFPYPSGDGLHVGHPRGYTASDVYAHYLRFHGKQVLHPIGWDAFGLPAENAAIKKGVHPAENTAANIENFRRQLKSLGYSYDWSREINTSDPAYYRWTQWIFLELFKRGLAYQAGGWQWWCPHDKTVLANEQVVDGACERCGNEVTKKELTQWFFKITEYANELVDSLEELDWPEKIKAMQRNWIGRSYGANVTFETDAGTLTVYTTRPDTLYGATYMVLAPEHELVPALTTSEQRKAVEQYVEQTKRVSEIERTSTEKEKTGVFTGSFATNPANGAKVPVWLSDYVLASYGTGAIMAVPAHDQRDHDFATKFDLPITQVVVPETGSPQPDEENRQSIVAIVEHPHNGQVLTLDWGEQIGHLFIGGGREEGESVEQTARREITEETGYKNFELVNLGGEAINHYYSITKQRARCARAKLLHFKLLDEEQAEPSLEPYEQGKFTVAWVALEKVLLLMKDPMHAYAFQSLMLGEAYAGEGLLTNSESYDGLTSSEARETIVADLAKKRLAESKTGFKLRDWLISRQRYWGTPIPIIHCDKCGAVPVPEEKLPVELPPMEDYLPKGDGQGPLATNAAFINTTCPQCHGPAKRETDTMDAFADSSWYFLRYPTPNLADQAFDPSVLKAWLPVDTYVGGAEHAVLHLLYARFWTKALADMEYFDFREPFQNLHNQGLIHATDGQKMSKSKGNVVNPDEVIQAMGADTLRAYELFIGPFDQPADWSTGGMEGVYRWLGRIWRLGSKVAAPGEGEASAITLTALDRAINLGIRNVTRSIAEWRFNTVVSALMETLNEFQRLAEDGVTADWQEYWERYLILLAPIAPHLAEELWHQLGHEASVFTQQWPDYDASATASDITTIVVQVNGKVRANLEIASDEVSEEAVTQLALNDTNVQKYLAGNSPRKVIYVEGKLLNLVA